MTSLPALRERKRKARLTALRRGLEPVLRQRAASALADDLLAAGLAYDVLALSQERWRQLREGEDPYWRAIGADAIRLDPL
jgi:hypothetical protein